MRGPLVRNEKQLHPVGALDQVADPASACRQLVILRCTSRAPHPVWQPTLPLYKSVQDSIWKRRNRRL